MTFLYKFSTLLFFSFSKVLKVFNNLNQDKYHHYLRKMLKETYKLNPGDCLIANTEIAIQNKAIIKNGTYEVLDIGNKSFSKIGRLTNNSSDKKSADAVWYVENQKKINKKDIFLVTCSIRSLSSEGTLKMYAIAKTGWQGRGLISVKVSQEWNTYFLPIIAWDTLLPGEACFGLFLNKDIQSIEFGGYTAINFGQLSDIRKLPRKTGINHYGGHEKSAIWRVAANDRIDLHRKANLKIRVKNHQGHPITGQKIQVKMLKHHFAFGTGVSAKRINGTSIMDKRYRNAITNLDSNRNGFNWVSIQNALKWTEWERTWSSRKQDLVKIFRWIKEQNLLLRGHNLIWPVMAFMPRDIAQKKDDINYVKLRINQHIEEILDFAATHDAIEEWDVLNEFSTYRISLEKYFKGNEGYQTGREILQEICLKAKEIDSNISMWLNDFPILSLNTPLGSLRYKIVKKYFKELIDADVGIEGLGFEGHIALNGELNDIPSIIQILDDYQKDFGLKTKITEFTMPYYIDEDLAGRYLKDFLTAIFSHQSMNGFFMWNFWDGETYKYGGANLFRLDWSKTPAYHSYIDLVFNKWWTNEQLVTNQQGITFSRVFKGLYEISYVVNNEVRTDVIEINQDVNHQITLSSE